MKLKLYTWHMDEISTRSILKVKEHYFHVLELPWIPNTWEHSGEPGGQNGISCILGGRYELTPFLRPSGERAFRLYNPDLGVYHDKADCPDGKGRFLILMHIANYLRDIEGCLATGLDENSRTPMVTNSSSAMKKLRGILKDDMHQLHIFRCKLRL